MMLFKIPINHKIRNKYNHLLSDNASNFLQYNVENFKDISIEEKYLSLTEENLKLISNTKICILKKFNNINEQEILDNIKFDILSIISNCGSDNNDYINKGKIREIQKIEYFNDENDYFLKNVDLLSENVDLLSENRSSINIESVEHITRSVKYDHNENEEQYSIISEENLTIYSSNSSAIIVNFSKRF